MILHVPTRPVPQKAAVIQNQARYQRRCISTPHAEEERGPAGLEKKKKKQLLFACPTFMFGVWLLNPTTSEQKHL